MLTNNIGLGPQDDDGDDDDDDDVPAYFLNILNFVFGQAVRSFTGVTFQLSLKPGKSAERLSLQTRRV